MRNRVTRRSLSIIALAVLASSPAFASEDYPPGLFESSPVVPSGPDAAVPSGPPDAAAPSGPAEVAVPFQPPNAVGRTDDYCAGVAFRTFRSLVEVGLAHARCDRLYDAEPPPPAE